jgi:2,3-bisphosphoglycerate-dependent phosphoglycerate mutase
MSYLILVRHGQSRWNLDNKFTGWVDVPLSENGVGEALMAAKELRDLRIDIAFTSKLERAQETLLLILSEQEKTGIFLHDEGKMRLWSKHKGEFEDHEIPIYSSMQINERFYGKLQGENKDEMREKYGKDQVFRWRRSYKERPPGAESLEDVYKRTIPYFKKNIVKELDNGKNVIVSAHGNSLRSIIKYLDNISDEEIPHLELPTGKPIIYNYNDGNFRKKDISHSFTRPIKW